MTVVFIALLVGCSAAKDNSDTATPGASADSGDGPRDSASEHTGVSDTSDSDSGSETGYGGPPAYELAEVVAGTLDVAGDLSCRLESFGLFDDAIGVSCSNAYHVLDARSGAVRSSVTSEKTSFGYQCETSGDIDHDGNSDVICGFNGEPGLFLLWGPLSASGTLEELPHLQATEAAMGGAVGSNSAVLLDDEVAGQWAVTGGGDDKVHGATLVFAAGFRPDELTVGDAVAYVSGDYTFPSSECASAGDFNGDGYGDLVVGGPGSYGGGSSGGNVADGMGVLAGPVTGSLRPSDGVAHIRGSVHSDWRLASTVRGEGDLDGDGYDDVVVTGYSDDTSVKEPVACTMTGAAYDQSFPDCRSSGVGRLETEPGDPHSRLGNTVIGDVDADGDDELVLSPTGGDAGGELWIVDGPISGTMTLPTDATVIISGDEEAYLAGRIGFYSDSDGPLLLTSVNPNGDSDQAQLLLLDVAGL